MRVAYQSLLEKKWQKFLFYMVLFCKFLREWEPISFYRSVGASAIKPKQNEGNERLADTEEVSDFAFYTKNNHKTKI